MEIASSFSTTVDALPVSVFNTNAEVGQAAASDAAAFLQQTIQARGRANIILATGSLLTRTFTWIVIRLP